MRRIVLPVLVLVAVAGFAAAQSEPTRPPASAIETLPASRGGQDLVGTKFPRLAFEHWLDATNRATPRKPRPGRPTLYRWWTDTCPYCEASLPAIEQLRGKYPGLDVVAVYHPKPPRTVRPRTVGQSAVKLGYRGTVAVDSDWSELRRAYLDRDDRRATSISILVDGNGIVRFVHPGPVLFPSDRPEDARENADFILLENAIRTMLGE